jgi:dethiobiotin synthase
VVTILISGAGTGVGKTRVCAALARYAHQQGLSVQIIKPVQTGVAADEPTDAEVAAKLAGLPPASAHTLRRYRAALAPLAAASAERTKLDIKKVLREILALPPMDLRLIEGAGGVAVPLGDKGWDWVDFAREVNADAIVLVVTDELGAINQARLAYDYTIHKLPKHPPCGVFLNAIKPPPRAVAASTRAALQNTSAPVWGELAADAIEPHLQQPLAELPGFNFTKL